MTNLAAYDPETINRLSTVPLIVGMVFAGAVAIVYGIGSRWYSSMLGVAFFGIMLGSSLPIGIILGRRIFGEYPGYEWVALGLCSLFAFGWIAMLAIILVERHKAPTVITLRKGAVVATKEVQADARQRSVRTLMQGLVVDVLVAVGGALLGVLGAIEGDAILTAAAWVTIATAVLKSVLTAIASYLARLAVPPTQPPPVAPIDDAPGAGDVIA